MEFVIAVKESFAMKYAEEKQGHIISEIETNDCKDTHAKRVTDIQKETGLQSWRPAGTNTYNLTRTTFMLSLGPTY